MQWDSLFALPSFFPIHHVLLANTSDTVTYQTVRAKNFPAILSMYLHPCNNYFFSKGFHARFSILEVIISEIIA
jgi:hypothetical protein